MCVRRKMTPCNVNSGTMMPMALTVKKVDHRILIYAKNWEVAHWVYSCESSNVGGFGI